MGTGTRDSPSWPWLRPQAGYVDADWQDQSLKPLADGAGHTYSVWTGFTVPHCSSPFADSRPLARSLARSTARAALRLLSSLRRFLFDLVMVASLHRLRSYPEPPPHGSLVTQGPVSLGPMTWGP